MSPRSDVVTSGVVKMVLWALVFLGVCATSFSAVDNEGFMDYLQTNKLEWVKKNPHHPKFMQMLNMVNLKTKNKLALYGVQAVSTAKEEDKGTHYDILFWPITEKKELPTCHVQFFIPLFGRHRDMVIQSYTCEPVTHNKQEIQRVTHLGFDPADGLLTLQSLH